MEDPFSHRKKPAVTWRALLIGGPLLVGNVYWLMANWGTAGYETGQSFATIVSLYYNVLFTLLVLLGANVFLRRFACRWALSQGELLTLYLLLAVGSSVAGHDMLQILFPAITYPIWFATPENRWGEFHRYLPGWLTIKDRELLTPFYQGHASLYEGVHLSVWLRPILVWSGFFIVLGLMMLGLVVLFEERWVRHEKLSYPIIQIPLHLTDPRAWLFRSPLLWMGGALAAGMDLVNGLHHLYPGVPSLGGALQDVSRFFPSRPLSAIGWTPLALYPFAVGLSFFIPRDLSFSIWFFFLFGKVTRILGDLWGWTGDPQFPYATEQAAGAWLGLALVALGVSRGWRIRPLRAMSQGQEEGIASRRAVGMALVGWVLGGIFLIGFGGMAQVAPGWTAVYFGLFFALGIAITRVRAEVGPPSHDLPCEPLGMLVTALGSSRLEPQALTLFTLFTSFNRAYRCHPMPVLLEGFALFSRSHLSFRRLVGALVGAIVVGTLAGAWAYYTLAFRYGGALFGEQWQCRHDFSRLISWKISPVEPNVPGIIAMLLGAVWTLALMGLRHAFLGFPLHPAGYALSLSPWNVTWYWFSIGVGWLLKGIVLKFGGLRTYRRALPFFVGMVLGEFVLGAVWSLLGIALGRPMYRFLF